MSQFNIYKVDVQTSVREIILSAHSKRIKQLLVELIREKHSKESLGQKKDRKGSPVKVDEVYFNERKAIGARYVDLEYRATDFWNDFSEESELTELSEFLESISIYNTARTLWNFCMVLMELGDMQYCLFTIETCYKNDSSFTKARANLNKAIDDAQDVIVVPNGLRVNIWELAILMTTTKHYVRQQFAQNRDSVVQGIRKVFGDNSNWDPSKKPILDSEISHVKDANPIKNKELEQSICFEVLKAYFKEMGINFKEA